MHLGRDANCPLTRISYAKPARAIAHFSLWWIHPKLHNTNGLRLTTIDAACSGKCVAFDVKNNVFGNSNNPLQSRHKHPPQRSLYFLEVGFARQPAKRPPALKRVSIALQPAILNARQLRTACINQHQFIAQAQLVKSVLLTVVGTARHASPALAVDIADVLLQARVGDTAGAVGYGAAGVLGAGGCEGEGCEGEDGGECELHFAGMLMLRNGYIRWWS